MPWSIPESFNKWKIDQVANKKYKETASMYYHACKLKLQYRFGPEIIIRIHKLLHIDLLVF